MSEQKQTIDISEPDLSGFIDLPQGITEIKEYSFFQDISLKKIHIPPTVTRICTGAFEGCCHLETISMITPREVESDLIEIQDRAFKGCSTLEHISIPHSVRIIGSEAFADCISLKSVNIPVSIKQLAPDCFKNCPALHSVRIQSGMFFQIYENTDLK